MSSCNKLEALLSGVVRLHGVCHGTDAMWLHADQDEDYKTAGCIPKNPNKTSSYLDWDCAKWAGFGTKFAFIQTGMSGHAVNGTTLAVFKKGSGLDEIINPCIDRYMRSKEYYEVRTQVCSCEREIVCCVLD